MPHDIPWFGCFPCGEHVENSAISTVGISKAPGKSSFVSSTFTFYRFDTPALALSSKLTLNHIKEKPEPPHERHFRVEARRR